LTVDNVGDLSLWLGPELYQLLLNPNYRFLILASGLPCWNILFPLVINQKKVGIRGLS